MTAPEFFKYAPDTFKAVRYEKVWWLKNVSAEYGAQSFVLDNYTEGYIPVKSQHKKNGQLWTAVTMKQLEKLVATNTGLIEIIPPDAKRCLYFDVDLPGVNDRSMVEKCEEAILAHFPGAKMNIDGSFHDVKTSFHITVTNYFAGNFVDMFPVKLFCRLHKELGFDYRVYKRNQLMKAINQSKLDGRVQAYVKGDKDPMKHLILHGFDDDAVDIATLNLDFPLELVKKMQTAKSEFDLELMDIPKLSMTAEDGFVWYTSTALEKLGLIPNYPRGHECSLAHAITVYLCRWARASSISFADFWSWCKSHDDSKERFVKYKCLWDQGCFEGITDRKLEMIIRHFYPSLCIPKETHDMKNELDVKGTKTISNKHVLYTDIDPRKKYTILRSAPGDGKTYATCQYLRHNTDRDIQIAWITSRRALNRNMEPRLGVTRFTWNSYMNFDKEGKESAEFEDTAQALCRLMMEAKKVIIMDALVSKKTIKLIEGIEASYDHPQILRQLPLTWDKDVYRPKTSNIEIIGSKEKGSPRAFMIYDNRVDWWANLLKSLESGKKVFLFVPTKLGKEGVVKLAKQLKKRFNWESGELIHYHADQHKEKDGLVKCEERWADPRVRCVLTNSCITVGVDFNVCDVFDEIHVRYMPVVGLRDFFQALYRVRNPKSPVMHLYRSKRMYCTGEYVGSPHLPESPLFRELQDGLEIEWLADHTPHNFETFDLFAGLLNISFTSSDAVFSKKAKREAKKMLDMEDTVSAWESIPDVDPIEMEKIRNKMLKCESTIEEVLQVQKYFFRKHFIDTTPDTMLSLAWTQVDFPRLVSKMIKDETHIVHRLFDEMGVEFGGEFPDQPMTGLDMKLVNKQFRFMHGNIKNTASTVARILEAYFKMKVLVPEGQNQVKGESTGKRKYKTTDGWEFSSGLCRKYMKVFNGGRDPCEQDITGGDDEVQDMLSELDEVPGVLCI